MSRKRNMTDSEIKEWLETQYELVDDCWIWRNGKYKNGYGQVGWSATTRIVHRLYWLLSGRTIPEGLLLRHGPCHNPACFNPDHLILGTHSENMADKIRDGTNIGPQGEKSGSAKLTEEQVKAIRVSTKSQKAFAEEYGVCHPVISKIINRKSWTHV